MQTPTAQPVASVPGTPQIAGGIKRVLNDWKISKKCHALYYGQIVVVPCPGEQRVVRGKPSWIPSSEDEWYRTSHITKFNRNSADELLSVETASKHIYHMGTKYAGKPIKSEPTQPVVLMPEAKPADAPVPALADAPVPALAVAYDIPMSEPASLLDVSGEENQTMEIIVDPNNPGMIEDDKKENETQLVAK